MQEMKIVYMFGGIYMNGMMMVVIGIIFIYVKNLKVRKSCVNYIDNIQVCIVYFYINFVFFNN